MPALSAPQNIYLNGLNTKFRAYVGGFGCMRGDTLIHTEVGLMRICDIDSSIRVLSWNENNQKFQLSLSGGAFPKGKGYLYRVVTQQGEFVASEHHRILSSCGNYLQVSDLEVGAELSSSQFLSCSNLESDQLSLSVDVQRYSKTDEDLMARYAGEARLYGQQLLSDEEVVRFYSPSLSDAHILSQYSDLFSFSKMDDQEGQKPRHNHRDLLSDHKHTLSYSRQSSPLAIPEANQTQALCAEHILHYHQPKQLSDEKLIIHRNTEQHSSDVHSSLTPCNSSATRTAIISIKRLEVEESYWDMQVLETNNYICESGLIHHNSGKTFVGCLDLLNFFGENPGTRQGYFGPSYPAIRDIFFPTFEEAAELLGFTVVIRESNKEVHVYRNGFYYGTVICRSMDNPGSIIGFKISRALVDEIDTLKKEKANQAWNKIIARLRLKIDGVVNGIGVTTTPEGFLFVYEKFKKDPTESYSMVQASTYENEIYLPDDYISSLRETYPEQLIEAYLNGEFVNLTSGTVYHEFDRDVHNTDVEWDKVEPLHIGMDFNVCNMSSIISVIRKGKVYDVDEITGGYDTPSMINSIKEKFDKCQINIYPDASGKNRNAQGASESSIQLLRQAGFNVYAPNKNPFVKDRVLAMNTSFNKGIHFVNVKNCPNHTANLEQQIYNTAGEPDKTSGNDHTNDGNGYLINYKFPVLKPLTSAHRMIV